MGFVLAIIFGATTVYTEFIRDTSPQVVFEVVNNTSVLTVRETIPDLEVLYRGEDVSRSGQTLSVLLIRIVNRGLEDLLLDRYDERDPVGVLLDGGVLIRADQGIMMDALRPLDEIEK